jgi:hypothetical protein
MQFSNAADRTGVIELLEDLTNTQSATSSSYPLKSKTRDINNAYANYNMIAQSVSGDWLSDDTNHDDYPIATTPLQAGVQNYSFIYDEDGNQILDFYRAEAEDSAGNSFELVPIDSRDIHESLTSFMSTPGIPRYYDKTANGIFLYPAPSYARNAGLKIYYSRTPSYFLPTDTNKKPGIPDMFHEYLAIRPAYFYALSKGLPTAKNYAVEMANIEERIKDYYASRSQDRPTQIRMVYRSSR